ncbi:MAG TPA: alpha/beta hydrolase domain-containing protein [Acidimicrobiia bacterium]|nr:alpha/beta hydrolase domain-containing protein [Acidimicrobiia bacterium]
MTFWKRALLVASVAAVVGGACASDDGESEEADVTTTTTESSLAPETVTVSGPVTGGKANPNAALQDLAAQGYQEDEFFVEGDASSFRLAPTADDEHAAEPADTAPYRTRIIVRRPIAADDFSGVVVVEWLNVSSGRDGDPDWGYLHPELLREGHAWVGVSAQAIGVLGGDPVISQGGVALEGGIKGADPARYGTLEHPGDAYAFDIFTQAGVALRSPDGPSPLGDLEATHVLAAGESQSAFFLTRYLNSIHPLMNVFDGFLVHSRGGGAPDIDGSRIVGGDSSAATIRTDLDEPVMIFETETDLTVLGYSTARQDDTDTIRTWEVAGTAHADSYLLETVYGLGQNVDIGAILQCTSPLNAGPHHEVLQAAFHHLVEWVREGTPPPVAPRLEVETTSDDVRIVRDEYGNARGGIRTPLVDVPVATLSGDPVEGGGPFCFLFGSTTPFDAATLAELYPTHDDYVDAFTAAADEAVEAGFLLRDDADAMIAKAEASDIGR